MGKPFWGYILPTLIVGNFVLQTFYYPESIFTDFSSYYRYWALVLNGANYRPAIEDGQVWRFFTSMFLHINLPHLMVNSIALLIVGLKTERIYGHSNFIGIYIMAGMFGGLTSFILGNSRISAGASGAIFGLIGANLIYFYAYQDRLGKFGKNNLNYTIGILIASILYGLIQPNIDNWAHIGGLIAGICIGYLLISQKIIEETNFPQYWIGILDQYRTSIVFLLAMIVFALVTWIVIPTYPYVTAQILKDIGGGIAKIPKTAFSQTSPTVTPEITNPDLTIPLNFNVIDAEYNLIFDQIIVVSNNPNQLHIYSPVTKDDTSID